MVVKESKCDGRGDRLLEGEDARVSAVSVSLLTLLLFVLDSSSSPLFATSVFVYKSGYHQTSRPYVGKAIATFISMEMVMKIILSYWFVLWRENFEKNFPRTLCDQTRFSLYQTYCLFKTTLDQPRQGVTQIFPKGDALSPE
jgi:hypothetical protein